MSDNDFVDEIQSGDYRRQLIALRDLIAHELSGNRCRSCQQLQMRSGDIAAMALRLQKVIEDLAAVPVQDDTKRSGLSLIRDRRPTGSE